VKDMLGLLRRIATKLKPSGSLVVSTFHEGAFSPLEDLMSERMAKYGFPMPTKVRQRVASPESCRALFAKAGFVEIAVETKPVGYTLPTAQDWWALVMGSAMRALAARLSPEQAESFRQEHLAEVARLATPDGIALEVSAIITRGARRHSAI
jgi:trans-aconitate methyltransferase